MKISSKDFAHNIGLTNLYRLINFFFFDQSFSQTMSSTSPVQIEESWKKVLEEEFQQSYFAGIKQFIVEQKAKGKKVHQ